jgi:hypothetical protein
MRQAAIDFARDYSGHGPNCNAADCRKALVIVAVFAAALASAAPAR